MVEKDGCCEAVGRPTSHLLGPAAIPAGHFADDWHVGLSAVIFANACSIAKLNCVMISFSLVINEMVAPSYGRFLLGKWLACLRCSIEWLDLVPSQRRISDKRIYGTATRRLVWCRLMASSLQISSAFSTAG